MVKLWNPLTIFGYARYLPQANSQADQCLKILHLFSPLLRLGPWERLRVFFDDNIRYCRPGQCPARGPNVARQAP
jgi:hypothetical protein